MPQTYRQRIANCVQKIHPGLSPEEAAAVSMAIGKLDEAVRARIEGNLFSGLDAPTIIGAPFWQSLITKLGTDAPPLLAQLHQHALPPSERPAPSTADVEAHLVAEHRRVHGDVLPATRIEIHRQVGEMNEAARKAAVPEPKLRLTLPAPVPAKPMSDTLASNEELAEVAATRLGYRNRAELQRHEGALKVLHYVRELRSQAEKANAETVSSRQLAQHEAISGKRIDTQSEEFKALSPTARITLVREAAARDAVRARHRIAPPI